MEATSHLLSSNCVQLDHHLNKGEKDLPIEILSQLVFKNLSRSQLATTVLVSRKWYQASIAHLKLTISPVLKFAGLIANSLDKERYRGLILKFKKINKYVLNSTVERSLSPNYAYHSLILNPKTLAQAEELSLDLKQQMANKINLLPSSIINQLKPSLFIKEPKFTSMLFELADSIKYLRKAVLIETPTDDCKEKILSFIDYLLKNNYFQLTEKIATKSTNLQVRLKIYIKLGSYFLIRGDFKNFTRLADKLTKIDRMNRSDSNKFFYKRSFFNFMNKGGLKNFNRNKIIEILSSKHLHLDQNLMINLLRNNFFNELYPVFLNNVKGNMKKDLSAYQLMPSKDQFYQQIIQEGYLIEALKILKILLELEHGDYFKHTYSRDFNCSSLIKKIFSHLIKHNNSFDVKYLIEIMSFTSLNFLINIEDCSTDLINLSYKLEEIIIKKLIENNQLDEAIERTTRLKSQQEIKKLLPAIVKKFNTQQPNNSQIDENSFSFKIKEHLGIKLTHKERIKKQLYKLLTFPFTIYQSLKGRLSKVAVS